MGTVLLAMLCALAFQQVPGARTEVFDFQHRGEQLVGLLDTPADGEARALLVIAQGHGPTDVVARNGFYTLRRRMAAVGVATFVWDKPGCGRSGGEYDHQRPVQEEAEEVRAALRALRERATPGSHAIGFWGISRAGWVVPLVLAEDPEVRFWISVSGTTGTETFGYLLRENLRIEGRTEPEVGRLLGEWRSSNEVMQAGGTYEEALAAAPTFHADPFIAEFFPPQSRDDFVRYQEQLLESAPSYDEETGLRVYVDSFDEVLGEVRCPVLAIFGERDCNVDWRATRALYEEALGAREGALLTVRTFPDGNHNLKTCETGGWRETMATLRTARPCEGYYDAMTRWLVDLGLDPVPAASGPGANSEAGGK